MPRSSLARIALYPAPIGTVTWYPPYSKRHTTAASFRLRNTSITISGRTVGLDEDFVRVPGVVLRVFREDEAVGMAVDPVGVLVLAEAVVPDDRGDPVHTLRVRVA